MMNKKILITIIIIIISTLSFSRSFLGLIGIIPWHYGYSDVFNEDRIDPALANQIPYLERAIEYPVITGFFIYLMWFLGKSLLGYAIYTWIFLTVFAIITALVLSELADFLKIEEKRTFWFFIFAPSLLFFSVYNWDIIAVMFMVLAVYFFYKDKQTFAAVSLALGFSAKLFPLIILPLMVLKTSRKEGIKMISIFLATFFVLNVYFIANSFNPWTSTYLFHGLRGPNMDSIWALIPLGTNEINMMSMSLFLMSYLILVFNHKKYGLISLSFMSLLLFLLFNKVFSPQYLLWLLPFFVLHKTLPKTAFYPLETVNLAVFFSTLYWIFASRGQIFLSISHIFVVARSVLLAYILYLVLSRTPNQNYHIAN